MVINGAIVSDLDMMYLESVLQEELSLVMMMRWVLIFNCRITILCILAGRGSPGDLTAVH